VQRISAALGLADGEVLQHQWVDNGPGWCAVMLPSAARVLAVKPQWAAIEDLKLGLVAAQPAGHETQFEVRALIGNGAFEDPVTGSLNASLAQWLIGAGLAPAHYVAAQGVLLQRAGRVHVQQADDGTVWVGGDVAIRVAGELEL
jgi:predicted PhzF superfamily epimerase YddE/YHI9